MHPPPSLYLPVKQVKTLRLENDLALVFSIPATKGSALTGMRLLPCPTPEYTSQQISIFSPCRLLTVFAHFPDYISFPLAD